MLIGGPLVLTACRSAQMHVDGETKTSVLIFFVDSVRCNMVATMYSGEKKLGYY